MMYLDEIEMLENIPAKDEVKSLHHDDEWFYLIKKNDERVNLFMVLEALTRREFEFLAHAVIKRMT